MYHIAEFHKHFYRVHEVAEFLGVTTKTIRTYDKEEKLKTCRTEGNHRVISREELIDLLKKKGLLVEEVVSQKRDVIYARVSSYDQKERGDLDRQVLFLVEHAKELQNPIILKEVGSGLNDKRVQLQKLLTMVCQNEIRNVYITYKDRLTRFGFSYLETMFSAHNVAIVVVQDNEAEKSVQEELVEDMLSLITSFSGKLYGMRSKKNTISNKIGKTKKGGKKKIERNL